MDRLFEKIKESLGLRQEIAVFNRCLKEPVWTMLEGLPSEIDDLWDTSVGECIRRSSGSGKFGVKEMARTLSAIRSSVEALKPQCFQCGEGIYGAVYPLHSEGDVLGVIVICGMKRNMPSDLQDLFAALTDSVIRTCRKEIEIEDINKTVRPRAIALSTVHTVHRLMTSTLNMNDLLPRIARLSLQVIRANRCSIKLLDKKHKVLLPKTTIDLRKQTAKLKKVEIGKYAPGKAVKRGASIRGEKFLATPLIDEDVVGVITLYDKLDGKPFTAFDEEIMKTLAEQAVIAITNAQLYNEQTALTLSSIKCIAQLLETRPHGIGIHRPEGSFLKLVNIIGRKFNMNETEINMLQYAGMLHDAGQLSIPEKLLMKRGELTGKEFDIIKKHPTKGASILAKFKPLKPIVPIILYHHENYDGSGYPEGLKGESIPLSARILGVVSAFEAMITKKPYRRALSISAAIKEVEKNSGKQFDPGVVEVFSEAVRRKDVKRLLEKELRKV